MRGVIRYMLVTMLLAHSAMGQNLISSYRLAGEGSLGQLQVGADVWIQSKGANTEFLNKALFTGGEVSNSLIDHQLNKMNGLQRLALHGNGGLIYRDLGKPLFRNWDWLISVGYELHSSINYKEDLFRLAFEGNTSFEGETADIGGTTGMLQSNAHVGFGLHDTKTGTMFALSFMLGDRFAQTTIDHGMITTADDVSSISAQVGAEVIIRDTAVSTLTQLPGWGITADFVYRFSVKTGKVDWPFQLRGNKLGFMRWNNSTQHYTMDTSVIYQGFSQDQIMDIINGVPITSDLMDTLGIRASKSSEYRLYPGSVSISKEIDPDPTKVWQPYFGVMQMLDRNALPLGWFGSHYRPTKWFALLTDVSYGGYSGLKVGLGARFMWPKGEFSVRCGNVYGLFPTANGWAVNSVLSIDL